MRCAWRSIDFDEMSTHRSRNTFFFSISFHFFFIHFYSIFQRKKWFFNIVLQQRKKTEQFNCKSKENCMWKMLYDGKWNEPKRSIRAKLMYTKNSQKRVFYRFCSNATHSPSFSSSFHKNTNKPKRKKKILKTKRIRWKRTHTTKRKNEKWEGKHKT